MPSFFTPPCGMIRQHFLFTVVPGPRIASGRKGTEQSPLSDRSLQVSLAQPQMFGELSEGVVREESDPFGFRLTKPAP